MSWFGKQLGKAWAHLLRDSDDGLEHRGRDPDKAPRLASAPGPDLRPGPETEPGDGPDPWRAIEQKVTAEVRAIVPKTMVESLCDSRLESASLDAAALQQAAANRIFANALYDILGQEAEPPFDPAARILQWAEAALDEAMTAWQDNRKARDEAADDGRPPVVQAVAEALERAAGNAVLRQAALKRIEQERSAANDA